MLYTILINALTEQGTEFFMHQVVTNVKYRQIVKHRGFKENAFATHFFRANSAQALMLNCSPMCAEMIYPVTPLPPDPAFEERVLAAAQPAHARGIMPRAPTTPLRLQIISALHRKNGRTVCM